MDITFDYYVTQGTYGITSRENLTLGTGGLATCVGIIVILKNDNNFCGHMDSDVEPKTKREEAIFKEKVSLLLRSTIPCENVVHVAYCSSGSFKSTQCIKTVISDIFKESRNMGDINTNLYITGSGIVADNRPYQNGKNQVCNGSFTITSLD